MNVHDMLMRLGQWEHHLAMLYALLGLLIGVGGLGTGCWWKARLQSCPGCCI